MRRILCVVLSVLLAASLSGCAAENIDLEEGPVTLGGEMVALADKPTEVPTMFEANTHPGTLEKTNYEATIDYSNSSRGYVMAVYNRDSTAKIKCQVKGPTTTYTYNLVPDEWAALPLSDGDGNYKVSVYRNTTGNKYATVLSATFNVTLDNAFEPFLHSNQYVNFAQAYTTQEKAADLIDGETDALKQIELVYDFVVNTLTYDHEKAATVQSGYLPDLDAVLAAEKGICFDYAALMAGMLRSQGVPCKLVVGYAGTVYHAWISVYSPEQGWIDGAIFFDGLEWRRMDPTFASSSHSSASILDYINDDSHYTAKYLY